MPMNSRRQLTYQMKNSLVEQIRQNPHQTTKDLQKFFFQKYNWEICQTTLSCILKKEGLGIKKIGGKGRNSLNSSDPQPQQQQMQLSLPPLNTSPAAYQYTLPAPHSHPHFQSNSHLTLPSPSSSSDTTTTTTTTSNSDSNTTTTTTVTTTSRTTTTSSSSLSSPISQYSYPNQISPVTNDSSSDLLNNTIINDSINITGNPLIKTPSHIPQPHPEMYSSTIHTSSLPSSSSSATTTTPPPSNLVNIPTIGNTSPKGGYKIYNTNILCTSEEDDCHLIKTEPNTGNQPAVRRNNKNKHRSTPITPTENDVKPSNLNSNSPSSSSSSSTDASSSSSSSSSHTFYPKNEFYDINIINPHVKRFRPSSQYQQLEKIVLKLACDLHRQHNLIYNTRPTQDDQQQQSQDYRTNPALLSSILNNTEDQQPKHLIDQTSSPSSSLPSSSSSSSPNKVDGNNGSSIVSTMSKSEMVKQIKKEILTSSQYQVVQKPIYLNQFIHKCLRRYQFTDELLSRLEDVKSSLIV